MKITKWAGRKFSGRVFAALALAAAVLVSGAAAQKRIRDLKPTVILISLDGFRYDYPDKFDTPTLKRLARTGVRAKWMIPSFPTKTFPNHYTIATGLYPEHHGIVDNNVWDAGKMFSIGNREAVGDPRWWLGEPIWVTAQRQGQIAASYFYVGSEAPVKGMHPKYWKTYNGSVPPQMRVDGVLSWLDLPVDERPTIITMYFSDTDDAGHEFGPDAEETRYAALNDDDYIARLLRGLALRGIADKVNIIVVSDHGMAAVDIRKAAFIDDYIDIANDTDRILYTHEINQIFPKPGKVDEVYSRLKKMPFATCWKKGELPERLHYNDGERVAPIVCSTEIGHIVTTHSRYANYVKDISDPERPRGGHGHDNRYPEMRALFIAHGPAFKRGFVAEPFANIEVYNVMCKILGLKPAPNDGDLRHVRSMLRK
ncbi:MAG: phosphodiesterase I [Acidobacteria bacterium OLB17]|nr:MAG: phosphodiesterase I [Acidobacteria bacterium OLB17]MCZ2392132.1 ectonucleotide pyrophosphatase/phosphodiesterase [Acidobacteriota bacterium]